MSGRQVPALLAGSMSLQPDDSSSESGRTRITNTLPEYLHHPTIRNRLNPNPEALNPNHSPKQRGSKALGLSTIECLGGSKGLSFGHNTISNLEFRA